jgi:hypothetical protein
VLSLLEVEPDYLKKRGLLTSFVKQYQRNALPGFCVRFSRVKHDFPQIIALVKSWFMSQILHDPIAEMHWDKEYWRGPSSPFPAAEFYKWVTGWRDHLKNLPTDRWSALLTSDSAIMSSHGQLELAASDVFDALRDFEHFAEQARRDEARLVMEIGPRASTRSSSVTDAISNLRPMS